MTALMTCIVQRDRAWSPMWLVLAGLLALYVPTFFDLAAGLWQDSTHSHGPIVLAVAIWLFASGLRADVSSALVHGAAWPRAGGLALAIGLLLYVLGRSQALFVIEVFSIIPVLLGCTLILFGPATARRLWFAYFFVLFLVPLPGSLLDAMTQPMKIGVSHVTELLLHHAGYPVGRAGVVLTVGQYQLLVADACAGLNSLFMLEAFGLLYLNVVRHPSALRNVALAMLIVPISFAANVIRVAALTLITYHHGDAAGQGFLHGFSGIVLLVSALLLIAAGDSVARSLARPAGWLARRAA